MNIKSISYLFVLLIALNSCSMFAKKNGSYAEISDTYTNKMPVFVPNEQPVKKSKDDFGVLEITQDGPGYEINLALDTGDENVNFTMDLPEQSTAAKQLLKQDEMFSEDETSKESSDVQIKQTNDDLPIINEPDPVEEKVLKTQTQMQKDAVVVKPVQSSESAPSSNDYLVSAQTQFYEDNYMGALEDIENAIKQDDTQALSFAIKGSILYKLGNRGAAKIAWERALLLNPKLTSVELSLQYLVGQ